MAKCVIIGIKGFLGKHLAYYLSSSGHEVIGYDIYDKNGAGYHKCDLMNKDEINRICFDVDFIFVFSGLTGTYSGFESYERYTLVNELGLLNLLDAIRHSSYRPRVIFPSTRLVYKGKEAALCEDDEKETKTIYAVNKIACEGYLQAYSLSFNIPYTVFRICVPFGNLFAEDYSFGTIGFFIRSARNDGVITLFGDGLYRRTFSSMKDVCSQIVSASLNKESVNQVYNIGGCVHSLREVAQIIANQFGVKVKSVPFPEHESRIESGSTFFDTRKIESLIGKFNYEDIDTLFC